MTTDRYDQLAEFLIGAAVWPLLLTEYSPSRLRRLGSVALFTLWLPFTILLVIPMLIVLVIGAWKGPNPTW